METIEKIFIHLENISIIHSQYAMNLQLFVDDEDDDNEGSEDTEEESDTEETEDSEESAETRKQKEKYEGKIPMHPMKKRIQKKAIGLKNQKKKKKAKRK